jgi:hypothetical protein
MDGAQNDPQAPPGILGRIGPALLHALQGTPDALTESALCGRVSGRRQCKRRALRQLIAQGHILRLGAGTKGNPFRYQASPRGNEPGLGELTRAEAKTMVPDHQAAPLKDLPCEPSTAAQSMPEAPTSERSPERSVRTYALADGDVLTVTEEEFESVVAVFRLLLRQDERNRSQATQAARAA